MELEDNYETTGTGSRATLAPVWNDQHQGHRLLQQDFPAHYQAWKTYAEAMGITSAATTVTMATLGWTPECHSAVIQPASEVPPPARPAPDKAAMYQAVVDDWKRRFICRTVSPTELAKEAAMDKRPQSTNMVYRDGLPFKVPEDVRPFYSTMFCVPKPGKVLERGVLALGSKKITWKTYINDFLTKRGFVMEDIATFCLLVQARDFLTTADVTEAYMTVHLNKRFRKWHRFRYINKMGLREVIEMLVLCYGASAAPRAWTKFLRGPINFLRKAHNIRCCILLDDLIVMHQDAHINACQMQRCLDLLIYLGCIIRSPKCRLLPSQQRQWCGCLINTACAVPSRTTAATTTLTAIVTLALPTQKRRGISRRCAQLIKSHHRGENLTLRRFVSVLGTCRSTIRMVPLCMLKTRYLSRKFAALLFGRHWTTINWDAVIPSLVSVELEELIWWRDRLSFNNGKPIHDLAPDLITESDACNLGAGMVIASDSPLLTGYDFDARWHYSTREIMQMHINEKEMTTTLPGIKTLHRRLIASRVTGFKHGLHDLIWTHRLDNMCSVIYCAKMGGRIYTLNTAAMELWNWCIANTIWLQVEFLAGILNERADRSSRELYTMNDWQVKPEVFRHIDSVWGPHTIDLMASRLNKQVDRFYSYMDDPDSLARDALKQEWVGENCWCCPPHVMIPAVLKHLRAQATTVYFTLITRAAPDAFYASLTELSVEPPIFIDDIHLLQPQIHDKRNGRQPKTFWKYMAWRLSSKPVNAAASTVQLR